MSETEKKLDEMSPVYQAPSVINTVHPTDEYKVGHHKPPLFLVVLYILVLCWCAISWIPFYGY